MENSLETDDAWENFKNNNFDTIQSEILPIETKNLIIPKPSAIYISTKTMIGYLNRPIDLQDVFWKIPIEPYQTMKSCIIKKQIKVNCNTKEEVVILDEHIENENNKKSNIIVSVDSITKIDNPNARKVKFKDVRKINVGMTKKDITCLRKKKKGAFYNCFVLVVRNKFKNIFKDIHVKIFNTGKLEIPGIQDDELLWITLNTVIRIIQPYIKEPISYERKNIHSVLINSNFTSNFFIKRDVFTDILKYKYNIHTMFDSCSYPGIQCKYYYNEINPENRGTCKCLNRCNKKGNGKEKNNCKEISFMIFRTGSILIVGNCSEKILNIIYNFLIEILEKEYENIYIPGSVKKKIKTQKRRKKIILISNKPTIEEKNLAGVGVDDVGVVCDVGDVGDKDKLPTPPL